MKRAWQKGKKWSCVFSLWKGKRASFDAALPALRGRRAHHVPSTACYRSIKEVNADPSSRVLSNYPSHFSVRLMEFVSLLKTLSFIFNFEQKKPC